MTASPTSVLLPVAIGLLVAWRLYARIRRLVGRQRLSTVRPWLTIVVFPLLLALLLATAVSQPPAAASLAAGTACGVALGVLGLRLTTFERTADGLFYTPNAHLGIALSLLLVLRLGYRALQVYFGWAPSGRPADAFSSPLTLAVFGTLAGYYTAYAIGLLRWRQRTQGDAAGP